jgi:uncharacterized protein YgiM (DUF1202 family)
MTIDTKINVYHPWTHFGQSRQLVEASGGVTPTPSKETKAIVVAKSGKTVNLRVGPSKSNRIIVQVPLGKTVTITSPGEQWAAVTYDSFKGYMMAEFLDIIGDGKGKY